MTAITNRAAALLVLRRGSVFAFSDRSFARRPPRLERTTASPLHVETAWAGLPPRADNADDLPAVCALTTLAFLLDAAPFGCHGQLVRVGKVAAIPPRKPNQDREHPIR